MSKSDQHNINNAGEISVLDLIDKIKSVTRYIKTKWVSIFIISILGALLGLGYATFKKPTYTAVCTFVLEDAKSGGLGQYAGIASLAGINLGDGGSGGIFQGDNILELYKSRIMIEKALLNSCSFDGGKQLLIDRFIDSYHLKKKWSDDPELKNINFNGNPDSFNRKQDSIITDLVELFNKNLLDVSKPDKKLNIIQVDVTSKDELFSKFFTEKLVQTVNDFYIQTKTKKAYQNVQLLQHQADSVKTILNFSINGVASAIDADPNANPQMLTLRTTSQKRQVDVQANTAIYSEMVKNLELEKISLRQEMPLIQVIDKPVLPLKKEKLTKVKGILIGVILGAFFAIGILIVKRIFEKL
ncbi:putative tyrosine kinase-like protein [Mucilaginibacter frigoritolerans]|jgi:hypothetical protein|uniref:Putative tyrosine kinase-like protein n=1 Tax=Mucilaginibacter frigoritolerans TaxID=652788 RepID=A0A562TKI7_9SPHI|nr:GNVR domain-containing protein [Mucilaginibacter frigoritolerans]TWI93804.1 putative tyrosine kinase-like protein [Mucilaginibacter frigoritolerans]